MGDAHARRAVLAWSRASRGLMEAMSITSAPGLHGLGHAGAGRTAPPPTTVPFSSMLMTSLGVGHRRAAPVPCTVAPKGDQALGLVAAAVPGVDGVPGLAQAARHGEPHRTRYPKMRSSWNLLLSSSHYRAEPDNLWTVKRLSTRRREHGFHLAAHLVGVGGGVHRHVGPAQALALLHRPHAA